MFWIIITQIYTHAKLQVVPAGESTDDRPLAPSSATASGETDNQYDVPSNGLPIFEYFLVDDFMELAVKALVYKIYSVDFRKYISFFILFRSCPLYILCLSECFD